MQLCTMVSTVPSVSTVMLMMLTMPVKDMEGYANGPAAYLLATWLTMQETLTGLRGRSWEGLENYNGSVYIIQGMQDWNVDPTWHSQYTNRSQMLE